jgi:uncharacterized membrane protein
MILIKEVDMLNPFFPYGAVVGTDGRSITLNWDIEKPSLGSTKSFNIVYEETGSFENIFNFNVFLVVGIVFLVIVLFGVLFFRKKQIISKTDKVLSLLRKSEKHVIDILLKNSGKCVQKVIVKETGFSKAKVSRIILDLSDRGIVSKEVRGRTNIISIVDETLLKKKI